MTTPHRPAASTLFLEDIRSPHARKRRDAFQRLDQIGVHLSVAIAAELCRVLGTDSDPEVRLLAVGVLARAGKDMGFGTRIALVDALRDVDARVSRAAIDALSALGPSAPPQVTAALVAVAREQDGLVRRHAATVLTLMGLLPPDLVAVDGGQPGSPPSSEDAHTAVRPIGAGPGSTPGAALSSAGPPGQQTREGALTPHGALDSGHGHATDDSAHLFARDAAGQLPQAPRFQRGETLVWAGGRSTGTVRRFQLDTTGWSYTLDGALYGSAVVAERDLTAQPFNPIQSLIRGDLEQSSDFALRVAALRLTHAYASGTAVCLSNARLEPLPHQVFVAHRALQQLYPRLLLADEVELGKTIEAGLIVKELRARIDRSRPDYCARKPGWPVAIRDGE